MLPFYIVDFGVQAGCLHKMLLPYRFFIFSPIKSRCDVFSYILALQH
jgi:hypothetical protein